MRKLAFCVSVVTALSGCGSFLPVVKLDELPVEAKHAAASVKILSVSHRLDERAEVLGVVEGHSCQNKIWDSPATRSGAIEQVKYFAHELGANAITNIQCGGREGTSVRTNCWELISCTAEAIRLGGSGDGGNTLAGPSG